MSRLELIYDGDCPNVEAARQQLRLACHEVGLPPEWREWDRNDPAAPDYARRFGSPAVLVDGTDVAGGDGSAEGNFCRVYGDGSGPLRGVPPLRAIISALRRGACGSAP
jgi:hypothetical protein